MGLRQSTTAATGTAGGGGSGGGGGVPHSLPHGIPLGTGGRGGGGRGSSADGLHFGDVHRRHHPPPHHQSAAAGIGGPSSQTQRLRGVGSSNRGLPVGGIAASNGGASGSGGILGSPGSDDSTPDEDPVSRAILRSSLPVHLFSFRDIKCPVCNKLVPPDDVECHFVMCLTRPRITYNEDVLLEDKDECVICFDELFQGDTIARLPCLCIYHKRCIDQWFKVKRSCPEHPND